MQHLEYSRRGGFVGLQTAYTRELQQGAGARRRVQKTFKPRTRASCNSDVVDGVNGVFEPSNRVHARVATCGTTVQSCSGTPFKPRTRASCNYKMGATGKIIRPSNRVHARVATMNLVQAQTICALQTAYTRELQQEGEDDELIDWLPSNRVHARVATAERMEQERIERPSNRVHARVATASPDNHRQYDQSFKPRTRASCNPARRTSSGL